MARTGIRVKLIRSFTVAILIPSVVLLAVGILLIRQQVYRQAEASAASDLDWAKEIYGHALKRIEDSLRTHATRRVFYGALEQRDTSALAPELDRVRSADSLDILHLVDASGTVLFSATNPARQGEDLSRDTLVSWVLAERRPVSGTDIVPAGELEKESASLAQKARMTIMPTPRAGPVKSPVQTSGMVLRAAAPVFSPEGKFLGALCGGMLLNRNFTLVDKIQTTVFKDGVYKGYEVGTATIFQNDVRISTNVKDAAGNRAIATRVSAEVAGEVLDRGRTWRGRAFVVNDWYISAYAPIRDMAGKTIGILYVGTLEKPYRESLWRILLTFAGIAALGVLLMGTVALAVAQKLSRPIVAIAKAARRVSMGDYGVRVEVNTRDEIGFLAENFNRMVSELAEAHQELKEWGESLERKVAQRTAEIEDIQAHLMQSEKLAAVGKLAAGVAHEINNPLTAVLTNSSLLLQELHGGDPRREDLQLVVDETLRCRRIVRSLLDFARQSPAQKVPMDLNRAVKDSQVLLRSVPSFRGISLFNHMDPSLPQAFADPDQVRQVLVNLYLNAAEAMPEGGQVVTTTRPSSLPGFVELAIEDDGEGIPDTIRDSLFEPFSTTKRSGTGLGLAVVYGILEAHGGRIELEPSSPRGTVARVLLPTAEGGAIHGDAGGEPPKGGGHGA
jgi:two-component system NtrC family sensor kinase